MVRHKRGGLIVVLSGPSGAGKSTVAAGLLARSSEAGRLQRVVTVTTRPPRPGEKDGSDYHFVSESRFERLAGQGAFLELSQVYGYRYGTPRNQVARCLQNGADALLILDANGRDQLLHNYATDLLSIFLLPPSTAELNRRLRGRNQDDERTIGRRLRAAQAEIARSAEYDHVIVNADCDQTVEAVLGILGEARRHRGGAAPPRFIRGSST